MPTDPPGTTAQAMLLAISDIEAARGELIAHGVDASQGFHRETGTACRFSGIGARVTRPHPERLSWLVATGSEAHEQHEKRTVQSNVNWPDWYAEYMVREQ
jgi:hypothetical protein